MLLLNSPPEQSSTYKAATEDKSAFIQINLLKNAFTVLNDKQILFLLW